MLSWGGECHSYCNMTIDYIFQTIRYFPTIRYIQFQLIHRPIRAVFADILIEITKKSNLARLLQKYGLLQRKL